MEVSFWRPVYVPCPPADISVAIYLSQYFDGSIFALALLRQYSYFDLLYVENGICLNGSLFPIKCTSKRLSFSLSFFPWAEELFDAFRKKSYNLRVTGLNRSGFKEKETCWV